MRKNLNILVIGILILGLFLSLGGMVFVSQAKGEPKARKIVVFKEGVDEAIKEDLINRVGGEKIKDLKTIRGKAVWLTPQAEKNLAKRAEVLRIDPDVEVYALENVRIKGVKPQPAQILTWNIDRVDAEVSWGISTGDPIKVGVIDTGIDLKHPDLQENIKGGYNAIYPWKSPNDDNGHGTHIAGIIAALNNSIGVIGVGPKIDLYAIKVLNASGSGYLSDVIEGLDWAVSNGMQVVNMSLGTDQDVQSFHDAILGAYNAGVTIVAAAGNSGGAVSYPAAYPEVIAVSATDETDQIASWSSRGPEVDLAAPGVNIYSTYKGSTYKTLSGTSMAAPHVTGAAALVIDTKRCDLDSDGNCTPAEVQQRLEQTAIDLGDSGKDNLYGAGLVNVYQALTQPLTQP
jgi:subtilisin family serine protease